MRVIRSAGQNVSPSDDGRLYDQIFTDGLFEDATVTALGGNNIALSALYGVICGRDFTAEAQTINATLPEADTASGYIYVEIDTSSDDIITIGTALAPFTPTYENINTNGAVAQMVIATYEASAVAVTSVTATYAKASAGGVGSLATIEASPATANYSVGSFLVYNGTLYKVTRAIAAGEALVVGTNISATTAGAELKSLNNGLTNVIYITISAGRIKGWCYKVGKICMLTITDGTSETTTANTVLFTLPQGYRPVYQVEFVDTYGKIRMRISENGQITNVEQSTTFIRGTCVFIAQ
ncbi:MAG TPA: hypothetical protein DCF49_01105 [Lachnospiraceae bacterium]|nr:hypothetical protein [Lachnospiraceae bacterium]